MREERVGTQGSHLGAVLSLQLLVKALEPSMQTAVKPR